jgi:ketosteroid isomerase-like protein
MTSNFADWLAICETKARYCRCLDSKDWAGYADCFTENFVLDTPPQGNVTRGRDAAVKTVRRAVETAQTAHQVHNPEITFDPDGNAANVIWAMQDRVKWGEDRAKQLGNAGHLGFGHYRERYVKCDDGRWRISSLVLSYLHMDEFPSGSHA